MPSGGTGISVRGVVSAWSRGHQEGRLSDRGRLFGWAGPSASCTGSGHGGPREERTEGPHTDPHYRVIPLPVTVGHTAYGPRRHEPPGPTLSPLVFRPHSLSRSVWSGSFLLPDLGRRRRCLAGS